MPHQCRFDDNGDCESCDHRDHLPKCLPGFAGGQGRSAAEIESIGTSLWRAIIVAVVLVALTCCSSCLLGGGG